MNQREGQERYIEQESLPASADCERAILGAILLDNKTIFQTASLEADDFALDSHRRIFRRMLELSERGSGIDFNTLEEALLGQHELPTVGGSKYVMSLTDGLPRVKNIGEYVDIVREKSRARMLLAACEVSSARLRDREATDEVLPELQGELINIVHHGRHGRSMEISAVAREYLDELAAIRAMDGETIGLSTGLKDLDELTTGFRKSEFYVFGARPGQGKTAWMCQAVRENCKAARKCSVFSVEVDRVQLMQRFVSQESGISVFALRDPRWLSGEQLMRVQIATAEIAKWPLLIEDSPRLEIKQLQAIARLHISQGAEAVWVDFLQRLWGPGRSPYEQVSAIAHGLWELARSTGVPVIALAQLRRGKEPGDEPTMEQLRESGKIEELAHAVGLFHRPKEVVDGKERHTRKDKIILAKQRSGPTGSIDVSFNGSLGFFEKRETLGGAGA